MSRFQLRISRLETAAIPRTAARDERQLAEFIATIHELATSHGDIDNSLTPAASAVLTRWKTERCVA